MLHRSKENEDLFPVDYTNEWIEIIPGFIPDESDKAVSNRASLQNNKDSVDEIMENISNLEIFLFQIKESIKAL